MISTTNLEQAKNLIKTSKERPIIVKAQNDEFNRKILEYGKFDILLDIESGKRKRTLRNIDSGFNHVLAKIATKNKIAIGIDLGEISQLKREDKATILERLIINIKACRKANTKIKVVNYKDIRDARDFLISLGASTKQVKEAF